MTYNPADYAEIERTSKEMSKPELEEYYVKDRNKRYTTCGDGCAIALGIIFLIFFIGFIGWSIAVDKMENEVVDNMAEISQEVCPYLEAGFVSSEAFSSSYDETRIVCNQLNSYRNRP